MTKRSKLGTVKPLKRAGKVGTSRCDVPARAVAGGTIHTHGTNSHLPGNGNSQPGNSLDVRRSMLDVRCSRVPAEGPVQVLESALATRRKSLTELSALRKWLADKSADMAALEKTGNLNDPEVLTELVQLQIVTGLLPRRIAVKEACDANAEQALTHATNIFIRQHLGPRVRHLTDRTRALVERELSLHCPDPTALLVAVHKSEKLRYIESLSGTVTEHPQRGALEHAQSAIQSWTAVDKFEATYLTEKQLSAIPAQNRQGASFRARRSLGP